jgi:hypothetical protein
MQSKYTEHCRNTDREVSFVTLILDAAAYRNAIMKRVQLKFVFQSQTDFSQNKKTVETAV